MDCLIIGGGLIGMLTARTLARAGLEVRLVERGAIGRESSWAGGGILSPLCPWAMPEAVTRLAEIGQRDYPALAASLRDETGIDPEWTRSGMLLLDTGDEAVARRWANRQGMRLEVLEGASRIAAIEPHCRGASRAVWLPDVAQVRNPRLLRALALSLDGLGIEVSRHTAVRRIIHRHGRVTGVETADGVIAADRVVIAGGAWSGGLLAELGIASDIRPVRGQMLLYRARPGLLRHIVLDRGHYLIPRRDGLILAGSTLEETGFDKSTTAAARSELARLAETLLPPLVGRPIVKHWAGLRPGTPDGIPRIGPVPGVEGLYVNAGHYRNGVLLAPASATLLSEILLDQSRTVDPSPYLATPLSSSP